MQKTFKLNTLVIKSMIMCYSEINIKVEVKNYISLENMHLEGLFLRFKINI